MSRWAARAVMAVADTEHAELRAEVERVSLNVDVNRAKWKAAEAALRVATQRIVGYDKALADGQAKVARVEAALGEWGMDDDEAFAESIQESGAWRLARDLRAALDGPA